MIVGIGIDVLEIERVNDMLKRYGERFKRKFFSSEEMDIVKELPQKMAGRIAGKEAVYKALSPSEIGLRWREIKILEKNGKPVVSLSGKTLEVSNEKGIKALYISISHTSNLAVAVAVAEG